MILAHFHFASFIFKTHTTQSHLLPNADFGQSEEEDTCCLGFFMCLFILPHS